ncbi:MAG: aldehyde dehydrogenase family protein [Acidobacteriota bacterium]
MARRVSLLVAGAPEAGEGTFEIRSPWDGRVVAEVARAGPATLARAADAAASAAAEMAALPARARAEILERAAADLERRADEVATVIVEEAGKPVTLARGEVARALDTLRAAAAVARSPETEALDLSGWASGAGSLALVRRVPVGPVLAITPFNFPLNLVAHKLAPAVAAGCPVVLKPASQTPGPAVLLGEMLVAAGLPGAGLSVVPCRGADAEPLVADRRFRLVTFTGSAEVGWKLRRLAWDRRVALELGGNAAVVVEPDGGDPAAIARRIAAGAFAYAGQSCISVQRVLVHEALYDTMRGELIAATERTPSGDPARDGTVAGPLIDEANADRVERWIRRAVEAGATLLAGGTREGNVVRPTLLENVPADQPLVCEEVFGPVAVLSGYRSFEDALARVNDSPYGLQAGIFTRDIGRIRRAWDVLEVGGVIQNDVPTWRSDPMPYGGVKRSGAGREGPLWAWREMTEERLLVLRPDPD